MAEFHYHFEWDENKAASNLRKHGISFELAATVFTDPLLLSVPDDEHSEIEERWQSIGRASNETIVVVAHRIMDEQSHEMVIRIISARRATSNERKQYEGES